VSVYQDDKAIINIYVHNTRTPKYRKQAQVQWLIPVILATQEPEIRRISVPGKPKQIVHKTLSGKNSMQKKGW
jgi:hypothetical protein